MEKLHRYMLVGEAGHFSQLKDLYSIENNRRHITIKKFSK